MSQAAAPHPQPHIPGQPQCRFCGALLSPHQAARGQVCATPRCEMRRVQEASRAVFQRDWQSYVGRQRKAVEAAAGEISAAAAALGGDPAAIAVGVVPRQDRAVVPLPPERREAFASHLDEIIAKAFAEGEPDMDLARREDEEAPEDPLIDATCATCQGKCCILGGPAHAFLTAENVQHHRARSPGATGEQIKRHYLDRLPARSVEHSCVYHGPRGCVLDRRDRGNVCNRYHCNPQTQLLQRYRQMAATKAIIVASEDDAGPAVAAYTEGAGHERMAMDAEMEPLRSPGAGDPIVMTRAIEAAMSQIPPDLPAGGHSLRGRAPACDWCGQPIDPHRAAATRCCGSAPCERRRAAHIAETVERQRHERYVERQRRVTAAWSDKVDAAAEALAVARGDLLVGVVPHQDKPVLPLPAGRRAAFEAHLRKIVAEGFAVERPQDYFDPTNRAMLDEPEMPLADACCATCQGSCCRLGAESMAFLSRADVCRFRLTHPDATPEAFVARYLGFLPPASAEDACVFQTSTGCNVPRGERADICNSFHCKGLTMLHEEWRRHGTGKAAIIAHRDGEPQALGLVDEAAGWRPMVRPAGSAGA